MQRRMNTRSSVNSSPGILLTLLTSLCVFVVGCGSNTEASSHQGVAGCSDLYASDELPEFELEFTPDELEMLEADCESQTKRYRPATFKFGSEVVDAMVRAKGNWSWRCNKMQFVISFNERDSKGRFHGLRKIVLDAAWYNPTLLAERLGASFLNQVGVPSSCVNNAKLYINGSYYGIYSNVERLDKEYLERYFDGSAADGNLYDGGEELRTNEEVADVSRRDALFAASNSLETIEQMVDLDQAIPVWAALAVLPDIDSYWAGVEINYFLYDHPARGFMWLPYDMDMTAPTGEFNAQTSSVDIGLVPRYVQADPFTYENPDWGKEALFKTVLSNEKWCGYFLQQTDKALAAYDVEKMHRDLDRWAAQIAGAVADDRRKWGSTAEHEEALATMKQFLTARREFVETWRTAARCPVQQW
jgi:hypothetical protein